MSIRNYPKDVFDILYNVLIFRNAEELQGRCTICGEVLSGGFVGVVERDHSGFGGKSLSRDSSYVCNACWKYRWRYEIS